MNWWCSALQRPWDWTPRPYLGVWLLCGAIAALYWRLAVLHRREHPDEPIERRKIAQFTGGVIALWIASDWPVGALGASYLSSIHMLQYMLYTLAAAPLLMLGTPEWMARLVLKTLRLERVWHALTRPLAAAVFANVVLVVTHSPFSVDPLRSSQLGSFVLDMIWLIAGFVVWGPLISPTRADRMTSAPLKLVYIFCAMALVPMLPGAFIAFSPQPLYGIYEMAPRVGISPVADQQFAGVLMKIGNIPIVWIVMGVIWFRWWDSEARSGSRRVRGAKVPHTTRAEQVARTTRRNAGAGAPVTGTPTAGAPTAGTPTAGTATAGAAGGD